jgi:hypothetical protein
MPPSEALSASYASHIEKRFRGREEKVRTVYRSKTRKESNIASLFPPINRPPRNTIRLMMAMTVKRTSQAGSERRLGSDM